MHVERGFFLFPAVSIIFITHLGDVPALRIIVSNSSLTGTNATKEDLYNLLGRCLRSRTSPSCLLVAERYLLVEVCRISLIIPNTRILTSQYIQLPRNCKSTRQKAIGVRPLQVVPNPL
jgi:hypothetical protein